MYIYCYFLGDAREVPKLGVNVVSRVGRRCALYAVRFSVDIPSTGIHHRMVRIYNDHVSVQVLART